MRRPCNGYRAFHFRAGRLAGACSSAAPHACAATPTCSPNTWLPRTNVASTRPLSRSPAYGVTLCRCCSASGLVSAAASGSQTTRSASYPASRAPLRPPSPASRAGAVLQACTRRERLRPAACQGCHVAGSAYCRPAMPPQAWTKSPSFSSFSEGSAAWRARASGAVEGQQLQQTPSAGQAYCLAFQHSARCSARADRCAGQRASPAQSACLPAGEWSVATLSMTPSASPRSSRARFSPSRSGGAHLNLRGDTVPGQQRRVREPQAAGSGVGWTARRPVPCAILVSPVKLTGGWAPACLLADSN